MSEIREFPVAAVVALVTRCNIAAWQDVHTAAEHLLGHPLATHQFGSQGPWGAIDAAIAKARPELWAALRPIAGADAYEQLAVAEAAVGKTVRIRKGDGSTARPPLDGIPDGTDVVVVRL